MALILVIDDDSAMRNTVRRMLLSARHSVCEAPDGRVGLALLQDRHPAVVITDILMPEKEGIETIREIRRVSPSTKIIAVSGSGISHGTPFFLDAAQKLGADATLAKPFRAAELLALVSRVLLEKDRRSLA